MGASAMGSAMGDDKSQLSLANRSVSNYIPKNHDNTPDQKNYNNLRSNNNDLTPNTIEYKEREMRDSQGFNARSTNYATGAPVARETRERDQYMNTTNNSQAHLRDRSPGGS